MKEMKMATKKSVSKSGSFADDKELRLTDQPIPKDLQDRVRSKIITARVKMLFHQPFFGTLVTRLQVYAADSWLPTMAVDGKNLYFNHKFVDILEPDELQFVFSHEILHLCYDHIGRCGDRNKQLYNIAADYIVNDELIQANVGKFPTTVPGLHDVKYSGWSSEQVYDDLYKQAQKNSKSMNGETLDDLLDKMLDEHLDGDSGKDGKDEKDGKKSGDGIPSCSGPAKMTEEERKQIKADMKQQILSAAQLSGIGNLPLGIQRIVNKLTAPKIGWRELLDTQLTSLIPGDYTFLKVNRKGWDLDAILPGTVDDPMLDIAVAIDTSGSISQEDAEAFLSEIKGIMDQYLHYNIKVFCFDTNCYSDRVFSSDNGDDIRTYQVAGGGGTDAGAIFRHLKEEYCVPLKLVIFSDCYTSDFGDDSYCPTIWIIKGSNIVPPFGVHAYYDEL